MLIFGEKAIPRYILNKGLYQSHCVAVGEGTHWGPILIDIKPMFYVFHEDMIETNIPAEDWIEQCLTRMVLSLKEMMLIDDPRELCEIMTILEDSLCKVLWCYSEPIEL